MQTAIIWNEFSERQLSWFLVDGDKSHLDNHYINSTNTPNRIADEIDDLMWTEDGDRKVETSTDFNLLPRGDGVKVIVCGMLP